MYLCVRSYPTQDSGDGGYFGGRKAAAVLKHGILSRYLPVYATKTGTYSGPEWSSTSTAMREKQRYKGRDTPVLR